jgi:stage V sporulation protein K
MANLFIQTNSQNTSQASADARAEGGEKAIQFLNDLQGLEEVKTELNKLLAFAKILAERKKRDLKCESLSMHMLFVGPPGTGKTEVARQVGKLLYSVGLLRRGHVIEASKKGLVGQYVGETPKLVQQKFDDARGGVLFVDEAYTLDDGQFGKEAIETLMKLMEDFRDDVVVIFAGYEADIERLLTTNPGLTSRFSRRFKFTNYQPETLINIFTDLVSRGGYTLDDSAAREAKRQISDMASKGARDPSFGNARAIRTLYEKVISAQSERLAMQGDPVNLSNESLIAISRLDIDSAAQF